MSVHEVNIDATEPEVEVTVNEPVETPEPEPQEVAEVEGAGEEAGEEPEPPKAEKPKSIPGSRQKAEENRLLKAQIQAMRNEVLQLRKAIAPPQAGDGRPKLENFNTVEEYLDAEFKAREAQANQAKMAQKWAEQAKEAKTKHEDFDEVADDFISMAPPPDVVEAILESDNGTELIHFLGSNPDELKRISGLPPRKQVLELGKLEAKLTAPKAPPRVTKAPPPITPVKAVSAAKPIRDSDGITVY